MAITNAQQYQQLVNKPANGKRPGYRGSDMGGVAGDSRAANTGAKDTSGADYGGGNQGMDSSGPDRSRTTSEQDRITRETIARNQAINEIKREQEKKKNFTKFGYKKPKTIFNTISQFSPLGIVTRPFTNFLNQKQREMYVDNYADKYDTYQDYLDAITSRFDNTDNGGGGDDPIIPLMAQAPSNMDQETEVEEEPFQRNFRLMADGGRAEFAEGGGIESRLEQLGGDVSSAEEMLQAINQRLQTAESGLGGGGGNQMPPGGFPVPGVLGAIPGIGGGNQMPLGGFPVPKVPGAIPGIGGGASIANYTPQLPAGGLGTLATLAGSNQPFNPQPNNPLLRPGSTAQPFNFGGGIGGSLTPLVQTPNPQENSDIFGYDPSGSSNAQDAYATAQKEAQKTRAGGFLGQVVLPGEMSFEDFSNFFDRGGLQPLRAAGSNSLSFPNLESLGKPRPIPMRGGGEMFRGGMGSPLQTALGLADGGRAALAEGGMPYEGGIMDLESGRQQYFLGKLVKKATRAVKKIAKSPIGKAALLYAGGTFLGGLPAFGGSGTFMANLKSGQGVSNLFKFGKNKLFGEYISGGPKEKGFGYDKKGLLDFIGGKAGAGILGSTALSYFMTPEEEEQQAMNYGADIDDPRFIMANASKYTNPRLMAEGGSTEEPVAKKTMPLLDMDGQEMDLRAEGGFVPIGRMEKADDVPARLSKNEFVFTAEAVRNAGEGDVDKGAEVMYNMMKNLESGGEVSEKSQGLEGAREMFKTSQRLEEVI